MLKETQIGVSRGCFTDPTWIMGEYLPMTQEKERNQKFEMNTNWEHAFKEIIVVIILCLCSNEPISIKWHGQGPYAFFSVVSPTKKSISHCVCVCVCTGTYLHLFDQPCSDLKYHSCSRMLTMQLIPQPVTSDSKLHTKSTGQNILGYRST